MEEKKSSFKTFELLERLKQDNSLVGCAVAHAVEVDCSAMLSCSGCAVETCNRMAGLIMQDMNDYVSEYRIHGMNIFDMVKEINLLNEKVKQLEHEGVLLRRTITDLRHARDEQDAEDCEDTLDGMSIHEWKVAYRQLEAKYMAAQIDIDSLVEDKRKLFRKLTALTLYCQRMPLSVEEIFKAIDADMRHRDESN